MLYQGLTRRSCPESSNFNRPARPATCDARGFEGCDRPWRIAFSRSSVLLARSCSSRRDDGVIVESSISVPAVQTRRSKGRADLIPPFVFHVAGKSGLQQAL